MKTRIVMFLALAAIIWAILASVHGCMVIKGDPSVFPKTVEKAPSFAPGEFLPPNSGTTQPIAPASSTGLPWWADLSGAVAALLSLYSIADRRFFHNKAAK